MHTVMPVYGTRPEAIKMAPVVRALQQSPLFRPTVVLTGQHRDILDQVNTTFGVSADADLGIMTPRQTLHDITVRTMTGLQPLLDRHVPDAVLVQGDTTSAMAAALAAFERKIPVVHIEAGLRSGDLFDPFPEEANRRIIGQIASLNLAPTAHAKRNLLASGVPEARIAVTGNTVIDALHLMLDRAPAFGDPALTRALAGDAPLVLVTAHRRENHGEPMRRIGTAVRVLAARFPDHVFVLPAHPNPAVREHLLAALGTAPNILVTAPVAFPEMVHLMDRATLILTDSGGVQEEAPALGSPVLVLRETTERPEAVLAGTSRLVGTHVETIVDEAAVLLTDPVRHAAMAHAASPFGDGHAAARTVAALGALLGGAERLPDFEAADADSLSVSR
ncbi:non-hydrolyzing UDP-N-acetylglucosamine 2-epimerase [Leifsonia shinshuensis]|uniref:non-hydrolyzing UDP-N-acetylglucosamine 2-epimerase n=1 Tax=Leifsonia shinshuensis TaxID=150026 RepID=UPI00285C0466|nr:UDP-N-acetylglucosamine 2-epimerase (non-hydrolyzing) [Leifsonia shinshuensis]MDR6972528.1 UDP-N-acetylglucosamine 2-epimerase (non-hydrolyzing) [Leifsonia shinshuensis]